jgi:hypothetical protein
MKMKGSHYLKQGSKHFRLRPGGQTLTLLRFDLEEDELW